jgi:hypothetical protein
MTTKKTSSPADSWGTPEHEAAMAKMRQGHQCRDITLGQACSHVISDKHLAALRKVWR